MKNLLLLLALFSPCLLHAQVEFAPLGATWYFEDNAPPLPWKISYIKVEVTGIDTLQGKACKRIESKNLLGYSDWGCSFYAPILHTYQEGARVFAYHDGGFYLLYNFDAVAGESWVIRNPPLAIDDSLVVVVDSVSLITVGNQTLRVQHVTNPGVEPGGLLEWGAEIVEGIGNTGFITPQWPTCDPWIFDLRCYLSDSIQLHLVSYPCDSTKSYLAAPEPVLRKALFIPNPAMAGSTVVLSQSLDADRVLIQNVLGAQQKTLIPDSNGQIALGDVPPGVYFTSVYKGSRLVGADKLVVLQP